LILFPTCPLNKDTTSTNISIFSCIEKIYDDFNKTYMKTIYFQNLDEKNIILLYENKTNHLKYLI